MLLPVVPSIRWVPKDTRTHVFAAPPESIALPMTGKTIGIDMSLAFDSNRIEDKHFSEVLGQLSLLQWFDRIHNESWSSDLDNEMPIRTCEKWPPKRRRLRLDQSATTVSRPSLKHFVRKHHRTCAAIPLHVSLPCTDLSMRMSEHTIRCFSTAYGSIHPSALRQTVSVFKWQIAELHKKLLHSLTKGYTIVTYDGLTLLWRVLVLIYMRAMPLTPISLPETEKRPKIRACERKQAVQLVRDVVRVAMQHVDLRFLFLCRGSISDSVMVTDREMDLPTVTDALQYYKLEWTRCRPMFPLFWDQVCNKNKSSTGGTEAISIPLIIPQEMACVVAFTHDCWASSAEQFPRRIVVDQIYDKTTKRRRLPTVEETLLMQATQRNSPKRRMKEHGMNRMLYWLVNFIQHPPSLWASVGGFQTDLFRRWH